jgi:hypothetical protein
MTFRFSKLIGSRDHLTHRANSQNISYNFAMDFSLFHSVGFPGLLREDSKTILT